MCSMDKRRVYDASNTRGRDAESLCNRRETNEAATPVCSCSPNRAQVIQREYGWLRLFQPSTDQRYWLWHVCGYE